MSTTFLMKRGQRALKRQARAHLAQYNKYGEIVGAWCWRSGFDMSSNVPWGRRVCKDCRARYEEET